MLPGDAPGVFAKAADPVVALAQRAGAVWRYSAVTVDALRDGLGTRIVTGRDSRLAPSAGRALVTTRPSTSPAVIFERLIIFSFSIEKAVSMELRYVGLDVEHPLCVVRRC